MNADRFLTNFGHLASAPEGVRRLRELVLHFAITGGLSKPMKGDSSADAIIESALKGRERYFEERNTRPSKSKNVDLAQMTRRLPGHWKLVLAGELVHLINGRAFKADDWRAFGLPIIRIQNLNNPKARFNYFQGEVSENHRVANGDMLLSWSGTPGTSFGAFIWSGEEAVLNQHIFKVPIYSELLNKAFLKMAINASLDALIGGARGGVGLKHVTKGQVEALLLPIPPVEEQKRIVAKVDELMALCDQLELQQQERQRRFPVLSRTCHTRFAEDPTPANLNRIFDEIGAVSPADLRKTILNLAVHGRISKPDARDGTVESTVPALASRALKTKDRGHPSHWIQVKLGELGTWKGGGTPSKSVSEYWSGTMPWVSPKDMKKLRISEAEDHISEAAIEGSSVQLIPENSLLMVVRGMILGRAFPVALTTREVTINQDMKALLPHAPETAEFLLFVLRAFEPVVLASIERSSHGTCKLLTEVLHSFPIPIPPLAEQRRIVAKVDELMALVDQLEEQQQERYKLAEAFTKACVASFTGTTQLARPEKMKAPKTELVSLVTLGKTPKRDSKAPLAQLLIKNKGTLPAKSLWQQSGLTIDAFYQQLKTELAQGWIAPPAEAEMKILEED